MDVKIELDRNGLKVDLSFPRIKITSKNKTLFIVSVSWRHPDWDWSIFAWVFYDFLSFYFHFTTFWKQLCFLLHYIYLRTLVTCRLFAASVKEVTFTLPESYFNTTSLLLLEYDCLQHWWIYNYGANYTTTTEHDMILLESVNRTLHSLNRWCNKLCTFPLI